MTLTKTHRAVILLGTAAFVTLAVPAFARPTHHGQHRHVSQSRHHHYSHTRHAQTQVVASGSQVTSGGARDDRYAAPAIATRYSAAIGRRIPAAAEQTYAAADPTAAAGDATQSQAYRRAQSHSNSAFGGVTSDVLVSEARKYIGTNPTGRGSAWCGAFLDMVLKKTGHAGGGNLAFGYARYGKRVPGPQVGAIAVMRGHVGVVSGVDPNGNPIIVSGNHNRTVAESVYPRGRIAAYVVP